MKKEQTIIDWEKLSGQARIECLVILAKKNTGSTSDTDLAQKIGVPREYIWFWRSGYRKPTEDGLRALSKAARVRFGFVRDLL